MEIAIRKKSLDKTSNLWYNIYSLRDKILNIDVEYKNSASIFFYIQYILLGGLNHENL